MISPKSVDIFEEGSIFNYPIYDLNDALSSNIVTGDRSPEDRSVGIEFGFHDNPSRAKASTFPITAVRRRRRRRRRVS